MSHTTELKSVVIRDVAALRQAVEALANERGIRCHLVENSKPRMYSASQGPQCEYVLKLEDGPYDVGFKQQEDGTFIPVFDEWNKHVAGQVGADVNVCPIPTTAEGRAQHQIGQVMQEYAKAAAINAAVAQGYVVNGTTTDDGGNVHIHVGNIA